MKKILLRLLFLAALGFLLSPAMASEPPRVAPALSAADLAFLASLAAPPAPAPAANRPSGLQKALCSATATCSDGTTRTCQSNVSSSSCTAVDHNCPTQQGYVTCDGATTLCPSCPPGCCNEAACAASCYPCPYSYTCSETDCTDRCRCNFRICPV
jgi:hypothetical protein